VLFVSLVDDPIAIKGKHNYRNNNAIKRIAVLVGSLRKESFTRKTAKALIALAPDVDLEILEIADFRCTTRTLKKRADAWTEFANG